LKKRTYLLLTVFCIVSMIGFPASAPPSTVRAQDTLPHKAFFPLVRTTAYLYLPFLRYMEPILLDDFEDEDPEWEQWLLKDPKDGFFEHLNGRYAAHVRDNSAMIVASPGWRPSGDFKLEVDGQHLAPLKKSFSGLGLAFSGDDEWTGYYALMIAAGAAQNFWAVVRFDNTRANYLTNSGYRGGPGFMKDWDETNRLMIVRIGDMIKAYCNGKALPGGKAIDDHYGPGRQVGLVVTSYEFDWAEMDFDNFQLTPLYEEDIGEYISPTVESEAFEFDTPALDLH
jgi:hypothetical protein